MAKPVSGLYGIASSQRKLKKLMRGLEGNLQKEYIKAGFVLRDEAKRLAPYDEQREYRRSRGWIRSDVHLRDAIFAAYGRRNTADILFGVNHGLAPHSHLIEFGWDRKPGGVPFLRPAVASQKSKVEALIVRGTKKVIEKAGR